MCDQCRGVQRLVRRVLEGTADASDRNDLMSLVLRRTCLTINGRFYWGIPEEGDRMSLANQAALSFYLGLHRYKVDECTFGYIRKIAFWTAADWVDGQRKCPKEVPFGPAGDDVEAADGTGLGTLEITVRNHENVALIREIRAELAGQEHDIWDLWLVQGLSDEEIRSRLPIGDGALRNARARMRRKAERVKRFHENTPALCERLGDQDMQVLQRVVVRGRSDCSIAREFHLATLDVRCARRRACAAVRDLFAGRFPEGWEPLLAAD